MNNSDLKGDNFTVSEVDLDSDGTFKNVPADGITFVGVKVSDSDLCL